MNLKEVLEEMKEDSESINSNSDLIEDQTIDEDQFEEIFDNAVELYYRAIKGRGDVTKEAHDLFTILLKEEPTNTEIMAYLGAVKALLARDELNLRDKGKYANEGLKLLDIAVLKDSSNPLIRMLRGNVANNLPENRFRRTQTAIEDFEHIVAMYEKNPSAIPETLYLEGMKNLVKANARLGNNQIAIQYAEKVKERDSSYQLPPISNNNDTEKMEEVESIRIPDELLSLYRLAVEGNEIALYQVNKYFSELEIQNSSDPTIKAFVTHCQSMKSTNVATGYVELFTTAIKTSQFLDKLVSDFPDFYNIRLVRALQSYRLPEFFFFRASTAARDFHFLVSKFEEDSSIFSQQQYEEILFLLGKSFAKLKMVEEAVQTWKKLIKTSPKSNLAKAALKCIEVYTYEEIDMNSISSNNTEKLYSIGYTLHDLGVRGSEKAAQQSVEVWELITRKNPNCTKAAFYYAASLTLMGTFCDDPNDLFRKTMKGLKLLDQAIPTKSEDHVKLYLKRAYILYPLPDSFFHSNDKIINDFETVTKKYEDRNGEIDLSKQQYLQVLADLGTMYERKYFAHKAREIWAKLAKEDENSSFKEFLEIKGI